MPIMGRPRIDPAEVERLAVDACRRAIAAGETSLASCVLRKYGARGGSDGEVRAARDRAIASGAIVPLVGTVIRGRYVVAAADDPRPKGGTGASRLSEYGAGLREDIAAAEAEFVERGELPGSGAEWFYAVGRHAAGRRRKGGMRRGA